MQKDLRDFERSISEFAQAEFAIGVANATDALELVLLSQNLKPGDEVIFCSHTMVATASAIRFAGGIPIPVEIGSDWLIDPNAVEHAIGPRTAGIVPTQLNGRICDMEKLLRIADKNGLFVVEDAAQALGAKYKGQSAGTFGVGGAISLYPAKVLGCFGDGGIVLSNNKKVFEQVYELHEHGRDISGELKGWGKNSRLDNLQAAFLNYSLKDYPNVVERRRKLRNMVVGSALGELSLPRHMNNDVNYDVFQNYEMQAENRDKLQAFLKAKGWNFSAMGR